MLVACCGKKIVSSNIFRSVVMMFFIALSSLLFSTAYLWTLPVDGHYSWLSPKKSNFNSIFCSAPSRLWITAQLIGGLGNQIFQVAGACDLARRLGACVFFEASNYSVRDSLMRKSLLLKSFPSQPLLATHSWDLHTVYVPLFSLVNITPPLSDTTFWKTDIIELRGYGQNKGYFSSSSYELRQLLKPPNVVVATLLRRFPLLPSAVGVHMRFGDKATSDLYPKLGAPYYTRALEIVLRHRRFRGGDGITLPHLYISTDDEETANQSSFLRGYEGNFSFLSSDPTESLWALSLCDQGIVTASSSFSWWAAFIRKYESTPVVMPRSAFLPTEPEFPGGYFPDSYAVVDSDGTILRGWQS